MTGSIARLMGRANFLLQRFPAPSEPSPTGDQPTTPAASCRPRANCYPELTSMRSIFEERPLGEAANHKLVGRVLLGFLVLAAALVGATAGLLLVYSTDLPQVEELEHYRPSSITELYDDQGRVIGSFALQRRVVASYDDYPQVLRDALISTEDKDFFQHSGIDYWRIVGAAYRDIESGGKVQGASTLTMQ